MKNEVSVAVYKLNFDYIFKNYLKKELWKQEWTLYKDGDIKATMRLGSIDVDADKICLKLKVTGKFDYNISYHYIPLSVDHRNIALFEKGIYSEILRLFEYCERQEIRMGTKYLDARDLDYAQEDRYREEAESILDSEQVANGDIRKAFVEAYISKHDSSFWRDRVVGEEQYKYISSSYLTFALFVGSTELYDRYKKLVDNHSAEPIDDEEFIAKYTELIGEYEVKDMGVKK